MNETVKKTSKKDKLFALKAITQAAEDAGMGLDFEDITAQMVTSRLTQLVSPDVARAEKTQITVAGKDGGRSRKLSAYRKIG